MPWLIAPLARTLRIIKQNVGFCARGQGRLHGADLLGMATLWMAIAADMGASLLVIANGLRLLHARAEA